MFMIPLLQDMIYLVSVYLSLSPADIPLNGKNAEGLPISKHLLESLLWIAGHCQVKYVFGHGDSTALNNTVTTVAKMLTVPRLTQTEVHRPKIVTKKKKKKKKKEKTYETHLTLQL